MKERKKERKKERGYRYFSAETQDRFLPYKPLTSANSTRILEHHDTVVCLALITSIS